MNLSEDVVCLIGSYFEEIEELNNLRFVSKDFNQYSSNPVFWENLNFSIEIMEHRQMFTSLVDTTIKNIKKNTINKIHIQILKKFFKEWSYIHVFGYNIFSHPLIMEFEKKEIEFLHSIGYPLSILRFKSTNESLKMYLSHKNEFTLLHFAVWTENKDLCEFLCQMNFKIDYDLLSIQPYVYALKIENEEIINILQPSHIKNFNENESFIIQRISESSIDGDLEDFEKMENEDEKYFENYHQPQTKNFTNLKETIIDFSSDEDDDSEPDLQEETISIEKIMDSSVEEISEEVEKFEKIHLVRIFDSYINKTYVETISRKPSQRNRKSHSEENPMKKRKLENPPTRSSEVFLSKYSFNPVIATVGEDFKSNLKFTPLALLILQQISENLLGTFFQDIQILQNLGFPHQKAYQLFFSFNTFNNVSGNQFVRHIQNFDILGNEDDGEYEFESDADSSSEEERDYMIDEDEDEDSEEENFTPMEIVDELFHLSKEKKRFPNKFYVEKDNFWPQ
jgi:hypothetical protein